MKKLLNRFFYILLVVLIFFGSCSEENEPKKQALLVEATSILTRTASELQTYIKASGLAISPTVLHYEVELFRVTYKTTYKGSEITASSIVILPKTSNAVGMVSFQHGTIVTDIEAPSDQPLNSTQLILFAALSSSGFITVVPDLIGFGSSKDIFHPYYVEEETARAVLDNIKAAEELASKKGTNFNKKLFLAGYSQGGYATMATHKAIEQQELPGITLIASFPAAGGYDIKATQEYFFSQQTYHQPYYLAYVALSYKSYYDWSGLLTDFFNEPYASRIPSLFDGLKSSEEINLQLTNAVPDLIKADLIQHIDSDTKYSYIVNAFHENSLTDWTPTIKMYMYHGDSDITVPYENSVRSYNRFLANGSSASTITFITLKGADHNTGIKPYLEDFFIRLLDLR
jgi:pimeloyl-ACP methyl ester carboxylesterase